MIHINFWRDFFPPIRIYPYNSYIYISIISFPKPNTKICCCFGVPLAALIGKRPSCRDVSWRYLCWNAVLLLSLLSATQIFSPKCFSPVWKITSPVTLMAPSFLSHPSHCVGLAHRVTWEEKEQNLLNHCFSSFSRSVTSSQDVRVWHFPHL